MVNPSERYILLRQRHEKSLRIIDLREEYDTISELYSLDPEYDPRIGEWTPAKETRLSDAIKIKEDIHQLESEIREINYKLRHTKSGRR